MLLHIENPAVGVYLYFWFCFPADFSPIFFASLGILLRFSLEFHSIRFTRITGCVQGVSFVLQAVYRQIHAFSVNRLRVQAVYRQFRVTGL